MTDDINEDFLTEDGRNAMIDIIMDKLNKQGTHSTYRRKKAIGAAISEAPDGVLLLLANEENSIVIDEMGLVRMLNEDGQLVGSFVLDESDVPSHMPLQDWLNHYSGQFRNEKTGKVEPGYHLFLQLLARITMDAFKMGFEEALEAVEKSIPNSYVNSNDEGTSHISIVIGDRVGEVDIPIPYPQ